MSKIQIYETDLTKRTRAYDVTSNAVYIPGFATSDKAANYGKIILCETIKDFEENFGKTPYKFTRAQAISVIIDSESKEDEYEANSYDMSYVYAKELLNLGLPVYYEAFNPIDSTTSNDSKAIENMYNALLNTELVKLKDRNEYNLKFITLGAYEGFNIGTVADTKKGYEFSGKTLNEILLTLSAERGDVLSLIDYSFNNYSNASNIYNSVLKNEVINTNKEVYTGPDHQEFINNYGSIMVG